MLIKEVRLRLPFFCSQAFANILIVLMISFATLFLSLCSEEESRRRMKELTQSIQNVRHEKTNELARRAEVIAYQKDQLQEAKAKAQLEITYENKKCGNHLEQVRERCYMAEQDMRREQDVIKCIQTCLQHKL
jgi:ABC-type transport system involved in cytochrome bd biosynthesis fused ATPase/permease subunit